MRGKKRKKRRTGLYLVMLVAAIFIGTLAVQGYSLKAECDRLTTEQSELQSKKEMEEKRQQAIKEQSAYMKTDQYIEDVAREKFGLVYDNEIIFKAADSE